jgi:hypothetical protein
MPELQIIGQVNNPDWIQAFGLMQKTYKIEDGIDATTAAKNLLQGLERTGTIEALGDIRCITGYAVGIKDDYTGMVGVFQIDGDTHTWENGVHTMRLQLNFDEIMDDSSYRQAISKRKQTVVYWGDE